MTLDAPSTAAPQRHPELHPASVALGGTVTVSIQVANYGGRWTGDGDAARRVRLRRQHPRLGGSECERPGGPVHAARGFLRRLHGHRLQDTEFLHLLRYLAGLRQDRTTPSAALRGSRFVGYPLAAEGEEAVVAVVAPANRAPVFREAKVGLSVSENAVAGAPVGIPVIASDNDRDIVTYSLDGADASLFAIGAMTGQISVAQGTALDFETRSSYAVTARAADGRNGQDTIAVTIVVTNVEEAGTVRLSSAEPEAGVALTAMLEDPDGGVSGVSWQWERSMNLTAWMEIPGGESAVYTPTEADEGYHLRATAAYSDGQGPNKRTHMVSANPVPVVLEPMPTPTPEATPTPMPRCDADAHAGSDADSHAEMRRQRPRRKRRRLPTPEATPTLMPEATPTVMPEATPTVMPEATPTVMPEATPTVMPGSDADSPCRKRRRQ